LLAGHLSSPDFGLRFSMSVLKEKGWKQKRVYLKCSEIRKVENGKEKDGKI